MGKLSRDPSSKKIQREAGKARRSDTETPCPCGCGNVAGQCHYGCAFQECVKIDEVDGGPFNGHQYDESLTLKITVTDGGICHLGCDPGDSQFTSGNPNRTYYINQMNCVSTAHVVGGGYTGFFFNNPASSRSDAPESCTGIIGAQLSLFLNNGGTGVQQRIQADYDAPALLGTGSPPTLWDTYDFCHGTTILHQPDCDDSGSQSPGGIWTIHVCPPCAVVCDGACVVIDVAGTECTSGNIHSDPIYWNGKYVYDSGISGIPFGVWLEPFGPGGCCWVFTKLDSADIPNDILSRRLVVWFDGADWQGILAYQIITGEMEPVYRTKTAASLTCTPDGLRGLMLMAFQDEVVSGTETDLSDCFAAVYLNDCTCPTTAITCCTRYTATFTGTPNVVLVYDGGGADPVWTETDSGLTIECEDDPDLGIVWKLRANFGGGSYFWWTPVNGACPPTTAQSSWFKSGTVGVDLISITKSMCP